MELNKEEDKLVKKHFRRGFRSSMGKINTIVRLYNMLCRKCKLKLSETVYSGSPDRTKMAGDLNNYCKECKAKLEKSLGVK